ncbi:MAG: putative membrane protein YedE/YeeE [Flavobacteriales bacterium]|jgi:uncharacterized membrane protein YedE/YeeE
MKYFLVLILGTFFGIVLYKSEAASWFRIYEMFHFEAFHMYGIMGSAMLLGVLGVQVIKRRKMKDLYGEVIKIQDKNKTIVRYLIGGTLFGLGWGLAGSCPGPIYVLIGSGESSMFIVLISALFGTLLYGVLKKHLPH